MSTTPPAEPTPHAELPGFTPPPPAPTPEIVIKSPAGLPLKILARGIQPGSVLAERTADGARRVYGIAELQCSAGKEALLREIDRACAADKAL